MRDTFAFLFLFFLCASVPLAKRVVNLLFSLSLLSLLFIPVLGAEEDLRFGRVLERELAGETGAALEEYRILLTSTPTNDPVMAERILYRIGLCEQRLNRPEEARKTWRSLVDRYPAGDPPVVKARDTLKRLEQELDRIVMEGEVRGQRAEGRGQRAESNSTTQQLNNIFILAGEWGNEPAALTGSNGTFRVERKVAGQLRDGRRYGLVFAEHPTLPLVGVGISIGEEKKFEQKPQSSQREENGVSAGGGGENSSLAAFATSVQISSAADREKSVEQKAQSSQREENGVSAGGGGENSSLAAFATSVQISSTADREKSVEQKAQSSQREENGVSAGGGGENSSLAAFATSVQISSTADREKSVEQKPQSSQREENGITAGGGTNIPPSRSSRASVQISSLELAPAISLSGRVVDSRGRPVADARVRVVGYWDPLDPAARADLPAEEIPFPFDNLLPPVFSATNGEFIVKGLVPGLRYVLTAEKEGYRLVRAGEMRTVNIEHSTLNIEQKRAKAPDSSHLDVGSSMFNVQRSISFVSVGSIILQSLGEVSLRGRVIDDSGMPVAATVVVWTLAPVEREVGRVATAGDGRFEIRGLQENLVALKIESDGCATRTLSGLKPMGQEVDVVVRRERSQESGVRSQKSEATPTPLNNSTTQQLNNFTPTPTPLNNSTTQQLNNFTPTPLLWLRGNPDNGADLKAEELQGRVVVYHYGSAYVESSLRSLYPREPGMLTTLMKLYGEKGLVIIWVLPEEEGKGEAARLALELYPDLPIAVLNNPTTQQPSNSPPRPPSRGNLVVGRDGVPYSLCSDQALFKAVKHAMGY